MIENFDTVFMCEKKKFWINYLKSYRRIFGKLGQILENKKSSSLKILNYLLCECSELTLEKFYECVLTNFKCASLDSCAKYEKKFKQILKKI